MYHYNYNFHMSYCDFGPVLTAKEHCQVFLKRFAVRPTHRSKARNTGRK